MTTYPIGPEKFPAGPITIHVKGTVDVVYPKAKIKVSTRVTYGVGTLGPHVYELMLDPEHGKWSDDATRKWSVLKIPVRVKVSIEENRKFVLVEVFAKPWSSEDRYWHTRVQLDDPYGMQTVKAFAQPAWGEAIGKYADHTYAAAFYSDGKRARLWPCGGDHDGEGHHEIASGEAHERECDCLSLKRADVTGFGLAGIIYGVDGVCHQATNRILCPARIEVTGAKAYKKSPKTTYYSYGFYGRLGLVQAQGREVWNAIKSRCECNHAWCSESASSPEGGEEWPGAVTAEDDAVKAEFDAARREIVETYTRLSSGLLTPTEYADRLNALINGVDRRLRSMLGTQEHAAIFGAAADAEIALVDPRIAERVFAGGAPALG